MPSASRSSSTLAAPAYPPVMGSPVMAAWSAVARSVFSGMVLTVPGATSSVTYMVSGYAGSLTPVDAHNGRWGCAPSSSSVLQRGVARDVIQNHLLQLLALTTMEEP